MAALPAMAKTALAVARGPGFGNSRCLANRREIPDTLAGAA